MAGFGGQGIMFMGKLLANASMRECKNVTWLPSYGPQMRGGTANCMVIISPQQIGSPFILEPSSLIVMNRPSLHKFESSVQSGGLITINSSMIKDEIRRKDIKTLKIPATEVAEDLGTIRVSNMVALGAFIGVKPIVTLDSLINSLDQVLSSRNKELLNLNRVALSHGCEMMSGI